MNSLKIMAIFTALFLAGASSAQSNHKMDMQTDPVMKMDTIPAGQNMDKKEMKQPAEKTLAPQTTCPVLGGAIDKKLFVDYKGKRIYVCCSDCINTLKKDPERYIKKLEAMGQSVETISRQKASPMKVLAPQTTCPVQGGPIDKNLYVDYRGKRIYVCCAGCINEVKKDPEKYIKKLESMGQGVEIIGNTSENQSEKMKM